MKAQVYDYLKQAIINGDLTADEIYSEQYFADKLNISRTPVREAILQLQHENMVEVKANRGIVVKPLYLDEIKKIVETRLAIEGYSCSVLAGQLGLQAADECIKQLEENLLRQKAALAEPDAHYKFMVLDLEFHQLIIDFTQNNYFTEIIRMLRARLEIATLKSLHEDRRLEAALHEHMLIVDALKTGVSHKAFEAFEFHMQKTLKVMHRCYKDT